MAEAGRLRKADSTRDTSRMMRLRGSAMRAIKVGDRVDARRGETGTAIELRADQVLVSFYRSGEQAWFDLAQVVRAGISPRK